MSKKEVCDEISCLRFPDSVAQAIRQVSGHELTSLRDVFGPLLSRTDDELLNTPVLPRQAQLNITAYLLRRTYALRESEVDNVEMRHVILSIAQECTPYVYRGRRQE